MTARDWGEENPGLIKRYIGRLEKIADSDDERFRDFALGIGKLLGLVALPPAIAAGASVAACETVHATLPAMSAQFTDIVSNAGAAGFIGLEVGVVGAMLLTVIGDPPDDVASRRVRGALRATRAGGIVATTATALLAATLDTGDAVHALHETAAAHTSNGAFGVAAGLTGIAIAGGKVYRAVAKPLPAKELGE